VRDPVPPGPGDEPVREWDLLAPFSGEGRRERILDVLAQRTDRLVLVLDRLYDPHNLSAILRTAEAFGLQRLFLSGACPEGVNPLVSLGAERWITLRREPDAAGLARELQSAGYEVAVSVVSPDALPLEAYEPARPVALVMGNEHEGLGPEWVGAADARITIPLVGFVRSLNVSVAAGILIAGLLAKPALAARGLGDGEQERLKNLWLRQSVARSERILRELHSRRTRRPGTASARAPQEGQHG
jgi:tRNA (guanosine-2'-O-)-methyltransferase